MTGNNLNTFEHVWLESHTYKLVMAHNSKLCDAREPYSVWLIVENYFTG